MEMLNSNFSASFYYKIWLNVVIINLMDLYGNFFLLKSLITFQNLLNINPTHFQFKD